MTPPTKLAIGIWATVLAGLGILSAVSHVAPALWAVAFVVLLGSLWLVDA